MRSRSGSDIQRRIGVKTSRDEPLARFTTMRVGGPADLFATVHNVFELRALVRFARARELPHLVLGRGSDVVISDRGVRGLVIQDRAEGSTRRGRPLHGRGRRPDGPGRDRDAEGRPDRARVRAGHPGLGRRGRVGERRGPRVRHGGRPRVARACSTAQGAGGDRPGRGPRARLPRQPVQARAAGWATPSSSSTRPSSCRPADPDVIKARLDEIRRWRQTHQPLGLPSAGSVFRNPDGDSAGRLIEEAGLKGHRIGGAVVSEKHANFIVNDQKGTAADVRRLADHVRGGRRRAPRRRAGVRDRVPRRLGGLAVAGMTPRTRVAPQPAADRRPARRPIGRARRLDRVGHGHRDGPGRRRRERPPGPHRPRRRVVVAARRPPPRGPPRGGLRRPGRRSAARARSPSAPRSTGWRPRTRPRSWSSACTGRSARTARSRRCSTRPAWPTRAPASRPRRSGMDKALFKRMCRGLGLPVVDWREVAARRWAADRAGVEREMAAFAAGAADPRLMVKPVRPRQLRGDDPRPRAGRARRGDRPRPALRHRRAGRDVPARGARPRGVGHRQRPRPPRDLRPGRDRQRQRVLRLRRQVHAGPVGDLDPGRGRRPRSGRSSTSCRATSTARSAPRASPGSTSSSRATGSSCPRSTRSRASRRSACSRRCRAEGGYTFTDVCVRIVELALERHRRPAGDAPADRPTCPDDPALAGPPRSAGPTDDAQATHRIADPPDAHGAARLGRPVAGPRRRPARDAARRRRPSTASRTRRPSRSATRASRRAQRSPTPPPSSRALEGVRARTCSGCGPGRSRPGSLELPTVRGADVAVSLPESLVVRLEERTADPRLAGRGAALPRRSPTGDLFARLGDEPAGRGRPACPSSRTAVRPRPGCRSVASSRPSTSMPPPASPR